MLIVALLLEQHVALSVLEKKSAQELDVSNAVMILLGVLCLKQCAPPSLGAVSVEALGI